MTFIPGMQGIKSKGGKIRHQVRMKMNLKKTEMVFKKDEQRYAYIISVGKWTIKKKNVWINISDIILVGPEDYQDNEADVILKYNLPEHAKYNKVDTFGPRVDDGMHFGNTGDDEGDVKVSKLNSTFYVPIFF
ncbi:unnamed protein product [Nyctereutes procyonoides]|uniref:(raccoon dog) hypothetical protein n=1 Tax=Nyctereutes procyonoides TaxID=34880 RepID=A0A811XZS9_NYCPR|nr:unnamed protein product [Nyctereutes procyonoides]